jgi:predicted dehydrogenase
MTRKRTREGAIPPPAREPAAAESRPVPPPGGNGKRVPVLVVGVGHLGKQHARVYREMPDAELVGVLDTDLERAREIGAALEVPAYDVLTPELLKLVRAASVVTPTPAHFEVARQLMQSRVSVLVEKPMADSLDDARDMIRIAEANSVTLQVGHIERFNPVILAASPHVQNPVFIECDRIHPFSFRSVDVSVVLDLMIHDIDLVLNLVNSPVAQLDAVGARVLSTTEDLANARITFENGCVAMVKASRVAIQKSRKMRIFCEDSYISLDHIAKTGMRISLKEGYSLSSIDLKSMASLEESQGAFPIFTRFFNIEQLAISADDALKSELQAFLDAVRTGRQPVVTGRQGLQAIEIAMRIDADIAKSRRSFSERRASFGNRAAGGAESPEGPDPARG